ncbi:hypothetical protein ADJ73_07275 [Arsenicicoccus sp. oral taxon 190]|nr:hypothetical protein ADJ73_07275 [Arsenicicoccus sp. oral taxon 190]
MIGLVLGAALVVPVLVGIGWWWRSRGQGRRVRRVAVAVGVAVGVLASQVLAVAGAAAVVNRELGFYPTWDALVSAADDGDPLAGMGGGASSGETLNQAEIARIAKDGWAPHPVQPAAGNGTYRDYLVNGGKAKTKQKVIAWMPPGYEKNDKAKDLPVVLVLGGAYVTTDFAANGLHFGDEAAQLVRDRKVPPFVALFPEINIKLPNDTECVDYPGGPQAYSWLAHDVPTWAVKTLGVAPTGPKWSVIGWSLGGYCAAKLHVNNPREFGAGASIQGFYAPIPDGSTGALALDLARNPELRHTSDVAWMLQHRPPANTKLLVMSSQADPQSWPQTSTFLNATRGIPGIRPLLIDGQGHTLNSWRKTLPTVLPYLLGTS